MCLDLRINASTFKIIPDENAPDWELIEFGNQMLDLLAKGVRSEDNKMLRQGKERFRMFRRYGEVRECCNAEELGLPKLDRPRFVRMKDGSIWWYLPDWETLSWTRMHFGLFRLGGRLLYLPLTGLDELLPLLCDRHLRLIRGWSQSYIEKHSRELRDLNEKPENRTRKDFVVETISFFLHWGEPGYPFLTPHFSPFNPVVDVYGQAMRVRG
jgi:hypothetical protein